MANVASWPYLVIAADAGGFHCTGQCVCSDSPEDGITENFSSEGFYCVTAEPFKLAERLQCMLVIPGGGSYGLESSIGLECHVTVGRIKELPSGFGLGCHIEDYSLVTDLGPPAL